MKLKVSCMYGLFALRDRVAYANLKIPQKRNEADPFHDCLLIRKSAKLELRAGGRITQEIGQAAREILSWHRLHLPADGQGNPPGFLADDQQHGIGLLTETERGSM